MIRELLLHPERTALRKRRPGAAYFPIVATFQKVQLHHPKLDHLHRLDDVPVAGGLNNPWCYLCAITATPTPSRARDWRSITSTNYPLAPSGAGSTIEA